MRGDMSKLPKWAREEIERLEREVEWWKAKANEGPEDSDTFRHEYTNGGRNGGKPLGRGEYIRFDVADDVSFMARLEGGRLKVLAAGSDGASGELHSIPRSSNSIELEIVGRGGQGRR